MARLLLFDPDERHAKTVVSALESQSHKLTVCASRRETLGHIKTKLAKFKVIILDFSNRPDDWEFLDRVCRLTITCVPKPGLLCLARTNWGPHVRLQVERKGAKILYEQSA